MWLPLVLVLLLPGYAFAQGNDTFGSISGSALFDGGPAEFTYIKGKTCRISSVRINHDVPNNPFSPPVVVDLSTANSNQGGFNYDFHGAMPAGLYHVRINGTIWTGATQIGTTTALSNTINFTGIALDPCHPVTWTPVRSVTDPGYTPLRITSPVGGSLIVPTETVTAGVVVGTLTKVDLTFDAENMNQTMEMVNTQTGFSAGAQTIISRITGDSNHMTIA
ncbi:hypothetical protein B0H10DRAFT_2366107 [Mycena sp. CBHHK59/15]|nr:hypothetical protein B0H10DRAFT_2366107 [Mycena sp. CBHHK59/15]